MANWQIFVTNAEYEPWWFFEEWEETIVSRYQFVDKTQALEKYRELAHQLLTDFPEHACKKAVLLAAWDPEDVSYCEDCEDDIQNYHGLMLMKDDAVYEPDQQEKQTYFSIA